MTDYVLGGQKWGSASFGAAGGNVTWAIDSSVPAYFLSVLTDAFDAWARYGNITFTQVSSIASSAIDFTMGYIDGPSNVLGTAEHSYSGSSFISAKVTFDNGEGWHVSSGGVASNYGVKLYQVALHEIGHAIGLDHYDGGRAVMNTYLEPSVTTLTQSDIHGVQAIYGDSTAAVHHVDLTRAASVNFNGDAYSDILLQNARTGEVYSWQLNRTNLVGGGPVGWAPGPDWQAKGTGDFNGDGRTGDVLLQNVHTGDCYIWELNGTNLVGAGSVGCTPGADWQAKGTGDFNGDGRSDILLQNSATGDCFIWELDGTNLVGAGAVGWTPGRDWQARGTGDFNGDGKSDILLQNSGTGDCFIWMMDGTNLIGGGAVGWTPGRNWQARDTGDFNGDGKSDILLQNVSTGDCYLWELNGTNLVGWGGVGWTPGRDWQARATGDFNGDGKSDILLQNSGTGDAYIWQLNGTSLVGGGAVGWTPGADWVVHA